MSLFRSKKTATVSLPSDPTVRRSHLSPNELLTRPKGFEGVETVGDIFEYAAKKYGSRRAVSTRDIIDIVEEKKMVSNPEGTGEVEKTWKYFTLSPPAHQTYTDLLNTINHLTSALLHLGFTNPSTPIASRPRVSIYAETSLNWQLMAQSFTRLGHVITTAYPTLGEEGLLISLVEPEVELVFCGEEQLGLVAKVVGRADRVRWVVWDGAESRADKNALGGIETIVNQRGGKLISLRELTSIGKSNPADPSSSGPNPTSEDIYCIMYTSGSTGSPKGVLLTHGNIISSLAGSTALWSTGFEPKTDLLMQYLPLSHILAQFLDYTMVLLGVPIAYARVKTLLDDSVRNCPGDFSAYRPTLIGGVPGIYEMIRKGMMKKISDAGPIVGTIFNLAVSGKQNLPWPLSAIIDKVLFARVKQATGGRLRLAVCGGGALSKETQLFLSTVLAPLIQGYGLTETCGMTTITTTDFDRIGSVGTLGPSCELKLVDCPDMGYRADATPPQGEIWLRGPVVFKGYFKQEDLTRESFTEDGWFKTGDIGQWEENGVLTIIDRLKNLVKLQNGEYIALDKLESVYKACDVVMFICIVAPPYADAPVAIVYPHEGNLRNHLKAAGKPTTGTPKTWAADEGTKKSILDALRHVGKRNGLGRNETIKDVVMTTEEWSPDNGMLTPAMKLARPFITRSYTKQIETAYGR